MRLIKSLFTVNTTSEQQRRANVEMHDKLVALPFPFSVKIWIEHKLEDCFQLRVAVCCMSFKCGSLETIWGLKWRDASSIQKKKKRNDIVK